MLHLYLIFSLVTVSPIFAFKLPHKTTPYYL